MVSCRLPEDFLDIPWILPDVHPILDVMKVMVTGADGLLGSNVVRKLLACGHQVGSFVQRGKPTPTLDDLPIEKREGDLLEPESLVRAFDGYHAVIHAAANTSVWPSRSKISWAVNMTGTEHVLDAVERVQADRLVCVGTANSFTPGTKEHPGDETTGFGCASYGLDYIDSKYEALKLIRQRVATHNLPALVIHPTFMIGPFDSTPSSGMMLIRLKQGRIPGYTSGGKSWTHVGDVATAIVNSLTAGRVGESYIAGNWNLSYKEFFELAAQELQVKAPSLHIPKPVTLVGGLIASSIAAVTHKPPLLSYHMAKVGVDGHYYDSSKAHRELDMPRTPRDVAVRECMDWLMAQGKFPA